jgi:hypothetical protein
MKRLMMVSSLALLAALYLGSGVAHAQHGHSGGGTGNMGGGMGSMGGGMSGTHGAASSHEAGPSAGAGHAGSMAASTNSGDVLDHNSHLSAKLEGLLGLSGPNALQTLKADASGFKNFGQFVAAVHVSQNLGIPFSDLQAKMTGPNAVSLGKAIQELKPDTDAKSEAKRATKQANDELKETS